MKTTRKAVCFAYFGDRKFLGWYSDSFGSMTSNRPKIYGNTESQFKTISDSFQRRLSELSKKSQLATTTGIPALGLIDNGVEKIKKELSQYLVVELRVVECPFYDGPNPNFDVEAHNKLREEHKKRMTEAGVFDIPAPSAARSAAIEKFELTDPYPKADNWIYADYTKVKEWASTIPTIFEGTLSSHTNVIDNGEEVTVQAI